MRALRLHRSCSTEGFHNCGTRAFGFDLERNVRQRLWVEGALAQLLRRTDRDALIEWFRDHAFEWYDVRTECTRDIPRERFGLVLGTRERDEEHMSFESYEQDPTSFEAHHQD